MSAHSLYLRRTQGGEDSPASRRFFLSTCEFESVNSLLFSGFSLIFFFPVPGSSMASETIVVSWPAAFSKVAAAAPIRFSRARSITRHCDCSQQCACVTRKGKDQLGRDSSLGAGHNCLAFSVAGHLRLVERQLPPSQSCRTATNQRHQPDDFVDFGSKDRLALPDALPRKRHASQEVVISALYLRAYMALERPSTMETGA